MKTLTILSIIQLIIILFLANKIFSLESKLENRVSALSNNTTSKKITSSNPAPLNNNEQLNQIRNVVRQELQLFNKDIASQFSNSPSLQNKQPDNNQQITQLANAANEEELIQLQQQIDDFMSDGQFSQSELHQFEQQLVKFSPQQQKILLQRMARAMNKSTARFIN